MGMVLLVLCVCVWTSQWGLSAVAPLVWWLSRWATKKDADWISVLERYWKEAHVYDNLHRPELAKTRRPRGWGRDLRL